VKTVFRDDSGPTKKRHMVISHAGPGSSWKRGPTLSHFSMQERQFSCASGGPRRGATGYTTTMTHFGLAQPSLKQSGKSTTNMSSRQSSMVGNGDASSTGLPRDKPSRRTKSSQTPVPPTYLGMQNKLPELGKVDKNPWVLQQVMGHKIEFHSSPFSFTNL